MPIYIFFIILNALGISYLFDIAKRKWTKAIVFIFGSLMIVNGIASSLLAVQAKLTKEARVDAIQFCIDNGITEENTLYDGYTPFKLSLPNTIDVQVDEYGNANIPPEIRYLIISSSMYSRYYAEPKRYEKQVNMYDNIQNKNELIYSAGGDYYRHSNIGVVNIFYAVKGLLSHNSNTVTGARIKIYRISQ